MDDGIPNVTDSYTWEKRRMILTEAQLHIPGLEMIGHCLYETTPFLLPPHTHNDSIEIVYQVNGDQLYTVRDTVCRLSRNQLLITPAGTVHASGEMVPGRYEIYWVRLYKKSSSQFLGLSAPYSQLLHQAVCTFPETVVSPRTNLHEKWRTLFHCLAGKAPIKQLQGLSILQEVLASVCLPPDFAQQNISDKMLHVVNYIQAHDFDHISLEELADVADLSLSRFKQRFKQEVGVSPREYVNLRKLEKAKELLKAGMSVVDTASRLGFSSGSYFSLAFKQNVGMPPSAFSKKEL